MLLLQQCADTAIAILFQSPCKLALLKFIPDAQLCHIQDNLPTEVKSSPATCSVLIPGRALGLFVYLKEDSKAVKGGNISVLNKVQQGFDV